MSFIDHQPPEIVIPYRYLRGIIPIIINIKANHQKPDRFFILINTKRESMAISRYCSIRFDNADIVSSHKTSLRVGNFQFQNVPDILSVYSFQMKHDAISSYGHICLYRASSPL